MKNKISLEVKNKSKVSKEEWKEFTKSVWSIANTRHEVHPAMFPPEIPHRLIKLFSFYNEEVLDPFCGIGTTGGVSLRLGRKFIGFDTNNKYLNIARRNFKAIASEGFKLVHEDSSSMSSLKDSSISLIVTSPPYWNKANYGKMKGNIGAISNYKSFLQTIEPIFRECFRVLNFGRRLCVVTANVHQNTTDGLVTFPLATDFINICRKIGFLVINEIIWSKDGTGGKWGSSGKQRPIFGSYPYPPNFLFKNVHEYILIFKKPELKSKTSKKIPSYYDLIS